MRRSGRGARDGGWCSTHHRPRPERPPERGATGLSGRGLPGRVTLNSWQAAAAACRSASIFLLPYPSTSTLLGHFMWRVTFWGREERVGTRASLHGGGAERTAAHRHCHRCPHSPTLGPASPLQLFRFFKVPCSSHRAQGAIFKLKISVRDCLPHASVGPRACRPPEAGFHHQPQPSEVPAVSRRGQTRRRGAACAARERALPPRLPSLIRVPPQTELCPDSVRSDSFHLRNGLFDKEIRGRDGHPASSPRVRPTRPRLRQGTFFFGPFVCT